MIKRWMNTNAATAAGMIEVSDEKIREWSNGEVKLPLATKDLSLDGKDCYEENEKIFGKLEDEELLMGHIELRAPVVNIQYVRGKNPVMARRTGIPFRDLERVIHFAAWIVVNPGTSGLAYKSVHTLPEAEKLQSQYPDAVIQTGAEAIEAILEREIVPDRESMILHTVPVLPRCMRYVKQKDGRYQPMALNAAYNRILSRINRLIRLKELDAPSIIRYNEHRMLQEYVNQLILNGAWGYPISYDNMIPYETLNDFYEMITSIKKRAKTPGMPAGYTVRSREDYQPLIDEWNALQKQADEEGDDLDENGERNMAYDRIEKTFKSLMEPFVRAVMEENFRPYVEGFESELMDCGMHAVYGAMSYVFEKKEPAEPLLCEGIYGQMDNFLKRRAAYVMEQEGEDHGGNK